MRAKDLFPTKEEYNQVQAWLCFFSEVFKAKVDHAEDKDGEILFDRYCSS